MLYTNVNGMKMSKLALGTADYGSAIPKQTAFELMDSFMEHGGNVLDTGRCYSYWLENGANASETTIGQYLKINGIREQTVIATKGGHPPIPAMQPPRINKEELTKDINESLQYLDTDYVDIYYLHRDDVNKPVEEIMPVLHEFVKSGKTRFIGASNWTVKRIEEANNFAKANGLTPFTFSETLWSYANINFEAFPDKTIYPMDEIEYAWYKKNGFNIMAYSSQAQGFFSVFAEKGLENLPDFYKSRYINEKTLKKCEKVIEIAKKVKISPTAVALNYLLHNPLNTVSIMGPINKVIFEDSLDCLTLPEEYIKELF